MDVSRPDTSGTTQRYRLAAWWASRPRLARDITLVLIVKIIVLSLLWYAFFRHPQAPHFRMTMPQVEQRLLQATPATPAPEVSHAIP